MADSTLSICMVTTFYPPYSFGGDGIHVYRLSNELARRGHRVTVVHSVAAYDLLGPGPAGDAFPNEPGVTVRPLAAPLGRLEPLTTYLTGRPLLGRSQLRDALRDDFDVVHFHNISLVGGPGVLSYGEGLKLYTMNEHWLVCPMHVLWKNNREPCHKPECLRCTLTFRRPPQLWRYTGLLERELDNVDVFLSPSRFTIAAHAERGFTRPIRHLPNFLPTGDVATATLADERPTRRPYFLFVGRLERLKGVQRLLDRFRDYREVDLLIAGDGNYGEELRRQAHGLPHVHFLGRMHPSALAPLYRDALALLVPSIGFETFGIVILEAFAQGTPAIVHDLGALPETIAESGGGLVYRSDAELTGALERLRLDPALRADLGERGRRAWLERWSEDPHIAGYLSAIEAAREVARR